MAGETFDSRNFEMSTNEKSSRSAFTNLSHSFNARSLTSHLKSKPVKTRRKSSIGSLIRRSITKSSSKISEKENEKTKEAKSSENVPNTSKENLPKRKSDIKNRAQNGRESKRGSLEKDNSETLKTEKENGGMGSSNHERVEESSSRASRPERQRESQGRLSTAYEKEERTSLESKDNEEIPEKGSRRASHRESTQQSNTNLPPESKSYLEESQDEEDSRRASRLPSQQQSERNSIRDSRKEIGGIGVSHHERIEKASSRESRPGSQRESQGRKLTEYEREERPSLERNDNEEIPQSGISQSSRMGSTRQSKVIFHPESRSYLEESSQDEEDSRRASRLPSQQQSERNSLRDSRKEIGGIGSSHHERTEKASSRESRPGSQRESQGRKSTEYEREERPSLERNDNEEIPQSGISQSSRMGSTRQSKVIFHPESRYYLEESSQDEGNSRRASRTDSSWQKNGSYLEENQEEEITPDGIAQAGRGSRNDNSTRDQMTGMGGCPFVICPHPSWGHDNSTQDQMPGKGGCPVFMCPPASWVHDNSRQVQLPGLGGCPVLIYQHPSWGWSHPPDCSSVSHPQLSTGRGNCKALSQCQEGTFKQQWQQYSDRRYSQNDCIQWICPSCDCRTQRATDDCQEYNKVKARMCQACLKSMQGRVHVQDNNKPRSFSIDSLPSISSKLFSNPNSTTFNSKQTNCCSCKCKQKLALANPETDTSRAIGCQPISYARDNCPCKDTGDLIAKTSRQIKKSKLPDNAKVVQITIYPSEKTHRKSSSKCEQNKSSCKKYRNTKDCLADATDDYRSRLSSLFQMSYNFKPCKEARDEFWRRPCRRDRSLYPDVSDGSRRYLNQPVNSQPWNESLINSDKCADETRSSDTDSDSSHVLKQRAETFNIPENNESYKYLRTQGNSRGRFTNHGADTITPKGEMVDREYCRRLCGSSSTIKPSWLSKRYRVQKSKMKPATRMTRWANEDITSDETEPEQNHNYPRNVAESNLTKRHFASLAKEAADTILGKGSNPFVSEMELENKDQRTFHCSKKNNIKKRRIVSSSIESINDNTGSGSLIKAGMVNGTLNQEHRSKKRKDDPAESQTQTLLVNDDESVKDQMKDERFELRHVSGKPRSNIFGQSLHLQNNKCNNITEFLATDTMNKQTLGNIGVGRTEALSLGSQGNEDDHIAQPQEKLDFATSLTLHNYDSKGFSNSSHKFGFKYLTQPLSDENKHSAQHDKSIVIDIPDYSFNDEGEDMVPTCEPITLNTHVQSFHSHDIVIGDKERPSSSSKPFGHGADINSKSQMSSHNTSNEIEIQTFDSSKPDLLGQSRQPSKPENRSIQTLCKIFESKASIPSHNSPRPKIKDIKREIGHNALVPASHSHICTETSRSIQRGTIPNKHDRQPGLDLQNAMLKSVLGDCADQIPTSSKEVSDIDKLLSLFQCPSSQLSSGNDKENAASIEPWQGLKPTSLAPVTPNKYENKFLTDTSRKYRYFTSTESDDRKSSNTVSGWKNVCSDNIPKTNEHSMGLDINYYNCDYGSGEVEDDVYYRSPIRLENQDLEMVGGCNREETSQNLCLDGPCKYISNIEKEENSSSTGDIYFTNKEMCLKDERSATQVKDLDDELYHGSYLNKYSGDNYFESSEKEEILYVEEEEACTFCASIHVPEEATSNYCLTSSSSIISDTNAPEDECSAADASSADSNSCPESAVKQTREEKACTCCARVSACNMESPDGNDREEDQTDVTIGRSCNDISKPDTMCITSPICDTSVTKDGEPKREIDSRCSNNDDKSLTRQNVTKEGKSKRGVNIRRSLKHAKSFTQQCDPRDETYYTSYIEKPCTCCARVPECDIESPDGNTREEDWTDVTIGRSCNDPSKPDTMCVTSSTCDTCVTKDGESKREINSRCFLSDDKSLTRQHVTKESKSKRDFKTYDKSLTQQCDPRDKTYYTSYIEKACMCCARVSACDVESLDGNDREKDQKDIGRSCNDTSKPDTMCITSSICDTCATKDGESKREIDSQCSLNDDKSLTQQNVMRNCKFKGEIKSQCSLNHDKSFTQQCDPRDETYYTSYIEKPCTCCARVSACDIESPDGNDREEDQKDVGRSCNDTSKPDTQCMPSSSCDTNVTEDGESKREINSQCSLNHDKSLSKQCNPREETYYTSYIEKYSNDTICNSSEQKYYEPSVHDNYEDRSQQSTYDSQFSESRLNRRQSVESQGSNCYPGYLKDIKRKTKNDGNSQECKTHRSLKTGRNNKTDEFGKCSVNSAPGVTQDCKTHGSTKTGRNNQTVTSGTLCPGCPAPEDKKACLTQGDNDIFEKCKSSGTSSAVLKENAGLNEQKIKPKCSHSLNSPHRDMTHPSVVHKSEYVCKKYTNTRISCVDKAGNVLRYECKAEDNVDISREKRICHKDFRRDEVHNYKVPVDIPSHNHKRKCQSSEQIINNGYNQDIKREEKCSWEVEDDVFLQDLEISENDEIEDLSGCTKSVSTYSKLSNDSFCCIPQDYKEKCDRNRKSGMRHVKQGKANADKRQSGNNENTKSKETKCVKRLCPKEENMNIQKDNHNLILEDLERCDVVTDEHSVGYNPFIELRNKKRSQNVDETCSERSTITKSSKGVAAVSKGRRSHHYRYTSHGNQEKCKGIRDVDCDPKPGKAMANNCISQDNNACSHNKQAAGCPIEKNKSCRPCPIEDELLLDDSQCCLTDSDGDPNPCQSSAFKDEEINCIESEKFKQYCCVPIERNGKCTDDEKSKVAINVTQGETRTCQDSEQDCGHYGGMVCVYDAKEDKMRCCVPQRKDKECENNKVCSQDEDECEMYCCTPQEDPKCCKDKGEETGCSYETQEEETYNCISQRKNKGCKQNKRSKSPCVIQQEDTPHCKGRDNEENPCSEKQERVCSSSHNRITRDACTRYNTRDIVPCVDTDGHVLYYICPTKSNTDEHRGNSTHSKCKSSSDEVHECPDKVVSCCTLKGNNDCTQKAPPKRICREDTFIRQSEPLCQDNNFENKASSSCSTVMPTQNVGILCKPTDCSVGSGCIGIQTEPCRVSSKLCLPDNFCKTRDCIRKQYLLCQFNRLRQSFLQSEYYTFRRSAESLKSERHLLFESVRNRCLSLESRDDSDTWSMDSDGLDSDCGPPCMQGIGSPSSSSQDSVSRCDLVPESSSSECFGHNDFRTRLKKEITRPAGVDNSSPQDRGLFRAICRRQLQMKIRLPSPSRSLSKIRVLSFVRSSMMSVRFRPRSNSKVTTSTIPCK